MAEVYGKLGDYKEASSAYETCVRLTPGDDESWQGTLIIKYAAETATDDRIIRPIDSAAATDDRRNLGMALIEWHWPAFRKLSPLARDSWWCALVNVCDQTIAKRVGSFVTNVAGSRIGGAVEIELSDRIFGPLKGDPQSSRILAEHRAQANKQEQSLLQALDRNALTLGQMTMWLEWAAAGKSRVGRALGHWVEANHDSLRQFILDKADLASLQRLKGSRNLGAHPKSTLPSTLSRTEVERQFQLAKRFLDALVT